MRRQPGEESRDCVPRMCCCPCSQSLLLEALGARCLPRYYHTGLLLSAGGGKVSKRRMSEAVGATPGSTPPTPVSWQGVKPLSREKVHGAEEKETGHGALENFSSNLRSSDRAHLPSEPGPLARHTEASPQAPRCEEEDRLNPGETPHPEELSCRPSLVTSSMSPGAGAFAEEPDPQERLVTRQQGLVPGGVVAKEGGRCRRIRSHPVGKLFDISKDAALSDKNHVSTKSKQRAIRLAEGVDVQGEARRGQGSMNLASRHSPPEDPVSNEGTTNERTRRISSQESSVPPSQQTGGVHTVEGLRQRGYSPEAVVLFLSGLHEKTLECVSPERHARPARRKGVEKDYRLYKLSRVAFWQAAGTPSQR